MTAPFEVSPIVASWPVVTVCDPVFGQLWAINLPPTIEGEVVRQSIERCACADAATEQYVEERRDSIRRGARRSSHRFKL